MVHGFSEKTRQYLADTARTWIGLPASRAAETPELPVHLSRLLLRAEEYERSYRDQWGCWEFSFGESFRRGTVLEPEIDLWVSEQRRALADTSDLEPLWPGGHSFAILLTHDVDLLSERMTPRQVLRSMRAGFSGRPPGSHESIVRFARPAIRILRALQSGIERAPQAKMLELSLDIEREHGVTATYYVTVNPEAPCRYDCLYDFGDLSRFRGERMRVGNVLRAVAAEGFEIGLHGSYESALRPGVLANERDSLREATGIEAVTTRQHFVHWDVTVTPRLQSEAGILGDSSVGFNRGVGFRAGTSLPFHHYDLSADERFDLLEMPFVVHDGALFRADALELDAELARETAETLLDTLAANGGLATFIFHPNNLANDGYVELLRFVIGYGKARNAWFASAMDVAHWWLKREGRLRER